MASGVLDAHSAVVTTLKTALASAPVSGRVHDKVPDAATFPYVQVTPIVVVPFDGRSLAGTEQVVRVDVWSRQSGTMLEAHQIGAAVYAALHDATLTLSSETFVNCRCIGQTPRRHDGVTVQFQSDFRIVTHS